ncbi:hypothetical protein [Methylophaga thalassica]|uniref:hypothetical protein n=1 Tax=Methylophaga thalassica TaxID=40223 RepID=UPI002E7B4A9B|nr:hypothetical protein [Methylophaga thalassica]WVI83634.1 hypothetical protein VSX76_00885 [Methylophaga thalassica]
MQKQLLKDLIDWIENSSLEDLALRRLKLEELIGNTMGTEVQSDLKLAIRLIDEEVVTRACLLPKSA